MFCPNCGKELKDDAAFCGHCGARLRTSEETGNGKENPVRRDADREDSEFRMECGGETPGYYMASSAGDDCGERAQTPARKGTGRRKDRFIVTVVIIAVVLDLLIIVIAMLLPDRSSEQSADSSVESSAESTSADTGDESTADESAAEETAGDIADAGIVSVSEEENDALKEVSVYRIDEDTGEELLTQRTRYDEEGRVTEDFSDTSVYMEEGWVSNDTCYQYDGNGNIELITKEVAGHSSAADEYYDYQYASAYSNEYDPEGRLVLTAVEVVQTGNNVDSFEYTFEREFEYNEDGTLHSISAAVDGESYAAELVYDDEGFVSALALTGSELYDIRFDFTYDEEGYLVSCTVGSGDGNSATAVGLVRNALEWGLYDDSIEGSWRYAVTMLLSGYEELEYRNADDGTLMWICAEKQDGTQIWLYIDARFVEEYSEEAGEEVSGDWELYTDESGRVTSVKTDTGVSYYEYYAD